MIEKAQPLLGLLVYPGLLWGLILTLLLGRTAQARLPGGGLRRGMRGGVSGSAPLALLLAALLPLAGLACLPWPFSVQPLATPAHNLLLFWGVLEASFALALLPGLTSGSVYGPRAAMREAQIGVAGRSVLWFAFGVAVAAGPWFDLNALPARVLTTAAMLAALPAAAVWGPFRADSALTPGGAEAGMSRTAVDLARWGRWTRLVALLALVVLTTVPSDLPLLDAPYRLTVIGLALLLLALGIRVLRGRLVARTLPDALHYCWWRALPLALLGLAALLLRS